MIGWFKSLGAAMATLLLAGCVGPTYSERQATFEGELNRYVGVSSDELILRFGVPTQTVALREGGQLFSYSRAVEQVSGGGTFTAYDTVRRERVVRDPDGEERVVKERVQVPVERRTPITTTVLNCNIRWRISDAGIAETYAYDGNDCF